MQGTTQLTWGAHTHARQDAWSTRIQAEQAGSCCTHPDIVLLVAENGTWAYTNRIACLWRVDLMKRMDITSVEKTIGHTHATAASTGIATILYVPPKMALTRQICWVQRPWPSLPRWPCTAARGIYTCRFNQCIAQ